MSSSSAEDNKRCAIVGAGACGLPCARWALAYGFTPVLFECRAELGGLWQYTPEQLPDGLATVMRCTVTNTSKEMTAYSDFPPDTLMPNYMRHERMLTYLRAYAAHNELEQYIRFGHTIVQIRRAPDYARNGKWVVRWRSDAEEEEEDTFDCVLLAVGHHARPKRPEWPGADTFRGRMVHAHDFRAATDADEGRVAVVVGAGDSATDMAVELSRVAKQVLLSTRSGCWVVKKCSALGGLPVDMSLTTRFNALLARHGPRALAEWRMTRALQAQVDHDLYALTPRHSPLVSQYFVVNEELPGRILAGLVAVKPDIRQFTETGVIWDDGTSSDPVDIVLLGTGYRFDFGLVEHGTLITVDPASGSAALYQHMFPLATAERNTLGVIGITQPTGSKMCVAEMQARLFFANLSADGPDKCLLPPADRMREEAAAAAAQQKGPARHAHEVDYIDYMDTLASLLGCRPSLWRLLLSARFRLFRAVLFGPNVSSVYRLHGPHAWPEASRAILGVPHRTRACMKTRACPKVMTSSLSPFPSSYFYGTIFILLLAMIFIPFLRMI